MSDVKVSVIVPVYNAEKYIKESLESIAGQSFRDFELILVNDGSTDDSLHVMQEFYDMIPNMVLVSQSNSGVSVARNNGIKLAKGEYVCFVDADDILHKDYLKILYNTACVGADIVFCEYGVFYNTNRICTDSQETGEIQELYHKHQKETFDYVMEIGFGTSPCIKMYKLELIKKNNIFFDEKSSYGEDMFFNWKVFLISSSVYYINSKLYFYRQPLASATLRFHPNLFESYAREYQSIREFAKNNNFDMIQIEKSISVNLAKRIPSFLRMNMRSKEGICKKINGVKELIDKTEIQNAIRECEDQGTLSKELIAIKNKSYMKVFYYGCIYEYRFRIARFIKNLVSI